MSVQILAVEDNELHAENIYFCADELGYSIIDIVDNANDFNVDFNEELRRVLVHGVLHYCGYKDKTEEDAKLMRQKENHYLDAFTKTQ